MHGGLLDEGMLKAVPSSDTGISPAPAPSRRPPGPGTADQLFRRAYKQGNACHCLPQLQTQHLRLGHSKNGNVREGSVQL